MPKESAPTSTWLQSDSLFLFKVAHRFFWFHKSYSHYKIILTFFKCVYLLGLFGNVNFIRTALKNGARFEDITTNLTWLTSFMWGGYIIYSFRTTRLESLTYFERHPQFKYPKKRLEKILNVNSITLKVLYVLTAMFLVGAVVILEVTDCDNSELNDKGCGTIYPLNFFINTSQRPYRELCNIAFVFLGGYMMVGMVTSLSFLLVILMLLEDCLDEYKLLLRSIQFVKIKTFRRRKLLRAYELHQFSIRAWSDVQDIFKWPLFAQYFSTAVISGLIITSMMIKFDILAIAHLSCYVCGTAFMGYVGEYLKQLSEGFKDATFYAIPWDGDVDAAKFLMFMNLNLRKGMCAQVGNGGQYNNQLVLMIYKTIYSMVMLLRHFT